MSKSVTIEGKTFKTVKEAAKYYNLAYETVCSRLRNGWSIEEAFELVNIDNKKTAKEITIEGKIFKSVKEACKYYNLSNIVTIYSRLGNGWTIEEAFELVKKEDNRGKKGNPITINGKTFTSITEAAKYYNLTYDIVSNRLKYGWSIEEAFGLVKKEDNRGKKGKPITIEGKTFKSVKEACDYYNLSEEMVYCRLRRGIPIDEAFGLIPRKRKYGTQREITVEGKTFTSITEAAKYYNLKGSKVRDRIYLGWSIEEAFELVPRQKKKK